MSAYTAEDLRNAADAYLSGDEIDPEMLEELEEAYGVLGEDRWQEVLSEKGRRKIAAKAAKRAAHNRARAAEAEAAAAAGAEEAAAEAGEAADAPAAPAPQAP